MYAFNEIETTSNLLYICFSQLFTNKQIAKINFRNGPNNRTKILWKNAIRKVSNDRKRKSHFSNIALNLIQANEKTKQQQNTEKETEVIEAEHVEVTMVNFLM